MNCLLCKKPAKPYETFWSLSWKYIDLEEYNLRLSDGRTTEVTGVCTDCVTEKNDRPPLGLQDLKIIRERGITKDQYYSEKGYKKNKE